MKREQLVTDTLFVTRLVGTLCHSSVQLWHMRKSIQGVSLSMFLCLAAFAGCMLFLSLRSHQHSPSRVTRQIVVGYLLGFILASIGIGILLWHWMRGAYAWGYDDNCTVTSVLIGIACVLSVGTLRKLPRRDPILQGWLANTVKSVPQALMAWKMWRVGGGGYTAIAIWTSHAMLALRLVQLLFAYRKHPTRLNTGLLIGELGNELSWCLVTLAWLYGGPP